MYLIYFADPLCSWCYGFGPELARLLERHPDIRMDVVMGGLRPGNRDVMSPAFKDMLREHWQHVAEASGLPFSHAIFERSDFIYDTEPPCRAVVTARNLDPAKAYGYLRAVHSAFYRDGRDATRALVLADIAAESGYDRAEFLGNLESEEMREATRRDFAAAQSMGVAGFPTLAVGYGPQLYLVTSGYVTHAVLDSRLTEIDRRVAAQTRSA
jgi:putative protein-disulfide isomerase